MYTEDASKYELTIDQERRLRRMSKAIRKNLDAVLDLAREAGCPHPRIFIESKVIYIMDDGHPGDSGLSRFDNSASRRQEAALFTLPDHMPPGSDVGAW